MKKVNSWNTRTGVYLDRQVKENTVRAQPSRRPQAPDCSDTSHDGLISRGNPSNIETTQNRPDYIESSVGTVSHVVTVGWLNAVTPHDCDEVSAGQKPSTLMVLCPKSIIVQWACVNSTILIANSLPDIIVIRLEKPFVSAWNWVIFLVYVTCTALFFNSLTGSLRTVSSLQSFKSSKQGDLLSFLSNQYFWFYFLFCHTGLRKFRTW